MRGGKTVPLKGHVDEALRCDCPSVSAVLVVEHADVVEAAVVNQLVATSDVAA